MTIRKGLSKMTALVSYKSADGVAIVIIDNPPMNVLSQQVQKELKETVTTLEKDDDIICVVLTTPGDKVFIAGADIKEFPNMIDNPNMREDVMAMHDVLTSLEDMTKPTIIVLDGLTLGGGCELALAFDIRIAEEHTQIGLPEVNLGIFPGGGGTQRLPRLIGSARAKEMMFTGEPISSSKAEEIGLINKVVSTGEGLNTAMELASKIAGKSLQSLSRLKKAVDEGVEKSLSEGIEREVTLFEEVFQTEDAKEGVAAFIEKRKANFTHK